MTGLARHDRYRLQIACRGFIACWRELCARQTGFVAHCDFRGLALPPFLACGRCSRCSSSCAARCPGEAYHETLPLIARGISDMNLSIRMRISIAAGVVVAAGLVGCQTCRDCVDRFPRVDFPRPGLPKLNSIVPFRKSKTPTDAEPFQPPKLQAVPDSPEPLILPEPSTTGVPSRVTSPRTSSPPALPPFEPETAVPSAGLFPPGPVRRMGFETSSVIRDSNIIQTGCCAPIVSSCCPPPCCSTGCGLSSVMGSYYAAKCKMKYKIQNAKARLQCKLSSMGSCCRPCFSSCCAPSCTPCGSCMNQSVLGGGVNQYPFNAGYSTFPSGMSSVPQIPMYYQATPQNLWRQPAQQFRTPQPPCNCQNQQAVQYPAPQYQYPAPQYQYPPQQAYAPQQQYPYPQTYQPTVPQQQVVQPYQYQPQPAPQPQFSNQSIQSPVAQPPQTYTAPQPVQPAPQEPSASVEPPKVEPQTSHLSPGHSPLARQSPSTRVARVYRATQFQ